MIARTILEARLEEVRESLRRARLMRHVAVVFVLGVLVRGALWLAVAYGYQVSSKVDLWTMVVLFVLLLLAYLKGRRNLWSDLEIARLIEQQHPGLDSVLLTAIDYERGAEQATSFLHERVIDHALARAATQNWSVSVADKPYRRAFVAVLLAGMVYVVTDITFRVNRPRIHPAVSTDSPSAPVGNKATTFAVTLTPGDVEVERGSRVIVEARFTGPVPAEATLVISEADGKERDRTPMHLTVDERVFGGTIAKADRAAKYHVEFAGQKSAQHSITIFDYPALVRADVTVTPPEYTKLPPKETKNTQKVSALEGSTITWKLKVNKTLSAAEFYGEDKTVVELKPSANDPTWLEGRLPAQKSQKYRLHLVDAQERANKNPPWFSVTVQSNQLAKIEVVFPKRDVQVSAIQELPVEATVSDDLGVEKSGAVFNIAGQAKEVTSQHAKTAPQKKLEVKTQLALEQEGAQPRQLVSYYFWAEDTGPKGEVRRSMSDMFFADVRHFEDIFREMEAPPSEPGQPKGQTSELVELQKQVVNATWRVVRETNGGRTMESAAPDVEVVGQSQGIAMEQAKEAMEKVEDAEIKTALTEAWKSMKDALTPLSQAAEDKKRSPLNQALTFEQTALEWLHRAMSREHQVMRSQSNSPGRQANQNQIMDLELKQQEKRYEEEKAATEEQTAEQQENLQVLSRLKELARRQEALAEKMKELQNQLAQAKTEEEKQELENQLQRLQAEQEQLLRDLDDLKDRMEKPDNAETMADAKAQLDQTREKVMEAAEQLKQQKLADAANSATRAQRELEKMQEDFRQKTSRKFAEEVKQLRQQARQAVTRQKEISDALENRKPAEQAGSPDDAQDLENVLGNAQLSRQVEAQQREVEKLLGEMRQLSEQAEQSEPLLHRKLYDAVRKAQTAGLEQNLQETGEQLRYGTPADAKEAERKAANSIEELQKGVDTAAEAVLGSETETLRVAKAELDKLIKEAEAQTGEPGKQATGSRATSSNDKIPDDPGGSKPAGQKAWEQAGKQPASGGKDSLPNAQTEAGAPPSGQTGQEKNAANAKAGAAGDKGQEPGQSGGAEPRDAQQPGEQPKAGMQAAATSPGQGGEEGPAEQQPGKGKGQADPGNQAGNTQGQGQGTNAGQMPQTAAANPPSAEQQRRANSPRATQGGGEGEQHNGPVQVGDRTGGRDTDNDRFRPSIQGGAVPESLFFEDAKEEEDRAVFTGNGYNQWSDRLRTVEELLNNPELRNEAAKILDRARELRSDIKRSNQAPQAAHLSQRITQPLQELRDRVVEELSKRDAGKNLAPVDRDPVPAEFRELVKRYYQELGAGK